QPLHSMELMLEILARMVQEPGQQELVADIAQAANIAAGLLNPLLDFSRLEAGMVQPEIEEFPIATLLRDMDVRFRPQVEKAGLELRIVPSNAVIRSDPVLLSLIVGNFLSNAERYTETGRLLLGCRRHGDALRIEVWDTGPGIESEHLNSIFEEFHQLDTATRDRDKGLGLGLAIVKAQASLLRHEVRVSTRLGRGSTFSIEVPLIGATAQPAPIMDADAVRPDFLAGRRMLILEDNLGLQRATKALLERWGGEVVLAANSSEAMNVIATDPAMLDLIIADYHLEDSDNGVDTVLQIRDQLDYDVPAIIVTADISNDSLRHADKNAFPLLQKPFRPAALRLAIAQSILENVQL
ncbi:MAG: hybrid sensor histidine kinase/response regulator, partial [Rhodospirillaceae bacterium]|nr:hybrid sensor histidine kinase/response regulator [Rhodospirillaceae bacterium]